MFAHCNSTLAFANGKWDVLHCSYSTKSRVRASKMKRCHQDRAQRASQDKADSSKRTKSVAQRGFVAFFCSIGACEKPSGDSRARSLCLKSPSSIFGALGTPAKPNRNVPRNALLCLPGLFLFRASAVAKVRKTTLRAASLSLSSSSLPLSPPAPLPVAISLRGALPLPPLPPDAAPCALRLVPSAVAPPRGAPLRA